MDKLKIIDIDKEIFSCSVPLENAQKAYILNGVLMSGKEDIRGVQMVSEKKSITIETKENNFLQIINVRENAVLRRGEEYCIEIKANALKEEKSTIVLCSHTLGDERFSTKGKINIVVEKECGLELIIMQNENGVSVHNVDIDIEIKYGGSLKLNIITLHGGHITNTINSVLLEEQAECDLGGLYLSDREQVINTNVNVLHKVGGGISRQLFKGILDGNSKTNFNGKIVVSPQAQKTEAYQANNNLLISDRAKATSNPHLIIYADDVKCSHGATIGTIGDEELFYMRSRGISLYEAKLLQQQAFAGAVLEKIEKKELKERLIGLVERRLRGESIHCQGCSTRCC